MKQGTKQSLVILLIIILWIGQVEAAFYMANGTGAAITSFYDLFTGAMVLGVFFVLVVFLLLKFQKENLKQFIFKSGRNLKKQLFFGLGLGTVIAILALFVIGPIVSKLIPAQPKNAIDFSQYFTDLNHLPLWLILVIFKGGISEELWRTFGLVQFQKKFGNTGLYIALILGSFVFAMGHYYQGIDSVVTSGIGGVIYGMVFIKRGSSFEVIIAHGFRDVISILLGYMVFY